MKCLSCGGDGWLRRLVPHPGIHGCMVTATRFVLSARVRARFQTQATSSRRIVRKKKILHFMLDKRLNDMTMFYQRLGERTQWQLNLQTTP